MINFSRLPDKCRSLILLILISSLSYAQVDSSKVLPYIFVTGKSYKVFVKGGFEADGVVLSQDSAIIKIKTQYKTFDIQRMDITAVEGFEIPEKEPEPEYVTAKVVRDTTFELDIYMTDRTLYKDVRIIRSEDSSVVILKDDVRKTINLYNINKIVFKESSVVKGIAIGSTIGFGIGFLSSFLFGLAYYSGNHFDEFLEWSVLIGLGLAIPGGIIGGFTGIIVGENKQVYDMSKAHREVKFKRLRYIIEENRVRHE